MLFVCAVFDCWTARKKEASFDSSFALRAGLPLRPFATALIGRRIEDDIGDNSAALADEQFSMGRSCSFAHNAPVADGDSSFWWPEYFAPRLHGESPWRTLLKP